MKAKAEELERTEKEVDARLKAVDSRSRKLRFELTQRYERQFTAALELAV